MVRKQPDSFAARLKSLRETAGLTAYALAKSSGVSKQTLSKLEQGSSLPSWEVACKLADALNCRLDDFRV